MVTHDGTLQVKRAKIDLLRSQYENFIVHENESIDDMVANFTKITNGLIFLGDAIDNDQKVQKVIRALSPSWGSQSYYIKRVKRQRRDGAHRSHRQP